MTGLSYTGSSCLLTDRVSGSSRLPLPPASRMAFMLPPRAPTAVPGPRGSPRGPPRTLSESKGLPASRGGGVQPARLHAPRAVRLSCLAPSPLVGEGGGGGWSIQKPLPPTPTLPHKGGGRVIDRPGFTPLSPQPGEGQQSPVLRRVLDGLVLEFQRPRIPTSRPDSRYCRPRTTRPPPRSNWQDA